MQYFLPRLYPFSANPGTAQVPLAGEQQGRGSDWLHTSCVYSTNTIYFGCIACAVCVHPPPPEREISLPPAGGGVVSACVQEGGGVVSACVRVWLCGRRGTNQDSSRAAIPNTLPGKSLPGTKPRGYTI
jgi:hypothetical protein